MGLQIILTDGNGVTGLTATLGAFIQSNIIQTAADAAAALASANSASTSASNAAASATAAATSASNSAASATAASNSASAAAGSATAAATSASNASSSASSASGSATAASNSASNAASSASAASTSATNAAASATAAATSASNAAATLANALTKANNLSDVSNAATAAHNLGLGTADTPTHTGLILSGSTAHGVALGQAGSAMSFVAPSATSGQPLLSQGSASDPAYGNLGVAAGGTGRTSITAFNVPIGNGTGALALAAPSTAGQALISAGASANPVFGYPTGALIGVQKLTGSGTYTPTAGTNSIIVELQGGGAGSAGLPANSASQAACAGSGATGGYIRHRYTSGFSGLSYSVGAAGAAGASGGGTGGAGGNTTFGTLTANGAAGGVYTQSTSIGSAGGGSPGTATGGNLDNINGNTNYPAWFMISAGFLSGTGPNPSVRFGLEYGWGGQGAATGGSQAAQAGSVGGAGVILVWEYA